MPDSRIALVRGPGQPPVAATSRAGVVLSSAETGWTGLVAERQCLPPMETPRLFFPEHLVCVHLNPGLNVEWLDGNRVRERRIDAGEVTILSAGASSHHRWHQNADFFMLSLQPSLLARTAGDDIGTRPVEFAERRGVIDPQTYHIAMAMKAELEAGAPSGRVYGDALAAALAAHLLSAHSSMMPLPMARHGGPDIGKAVEFIHDNLTDEVTLAQIAAAAGVSVFHFSRLFKQAMGLAPHQYIIRQRVERAKNILTAGGVTVGEAASRVGFADQSHLARHVRRILGISPRDLLPNSKNVPKMSVARTNVQDAAQGNSAE